MICDTSVREDKRDSESLHRGPSLWYLKKMPESCEANVSH
jgi:hypothetical protein